MEQINRQKGVITIGVIITIIITLMFIFIAIFFFQSQPPLGAIINNNLVENCPSSLKSCGSGCIPQNAACCDEINGNSYCLAPNTLCKANPKYEIGGSENRFLCSDKGDESNDCKTGQISCGMFCIAEGAKCCVGDCPGSISSITNPYVGTYEFKGEYEYNNDKRCTNQKQNDRTGWISSTLNIRVTFEPVSNLYQGFWDNYTVVVSKLLADDQDFGTGTGGIDPKSYSGNGKSPELILPMLPRWTDDPVNYAVTEKSVDYPDGKKRDPMAQHNISFDFPNDFHVTLFNRMTEAYYMSPDGKIFHSLTQNTNDIFSTGNTWDAHGSVGSGNFSESVRNPGNATMCPIRFTSWTFTKI